MSRYLIQTHVGEEQCFSFSFSGDKVREGSASWREPLPIKGTVLPEKKNPGAGLDVENN
jgi:hypothetical protein